MLISSSFEVSGNKYTAAAHFDHKAAVDDHLRSLSLPNTVIRLGVYSSEIISNFVAPLPTDPPFYGLFFPGAASESTLIPIIDAAADLGKFVNSILLNPEKTIGHSFNVAEKSYTLGQITEILQQQGLKIFLYPIDMETFKAGLAAKRLPESFQTAMQHVVEYLLEYGYFHGEGIVEALEVSLTIHYLFYQTELGLTNFETNSLSLNHSRPSKILSGQIPHSISFRNSSSMGKIGIY